MVQVANAAICQFAAFPSLFTGQKTMRFWLQNRELLLSTIRLVSATRDGGGRASSASC